MMVYKTRTYLGIIPHALLQIETYSAFEVHHFQKLSFSRAEFSWNVTKLSRRHWLFFPGSRSEFWTSLLNLPRKSNKFCNLYVLPFIIWHEVNQTNCNECIYLPLSLSLTFGAYLNKVLDKVLRFQTNWSLWYLKHTKNFRTVWLFMRFRYHRDPGLISAEIRALCRISRHANDHASTVASLSSN